MRVNFPPALLTAQTTLALLLTLLGACGPVHEPRPAPQSDATFEGESAPSAATEAAPPEPASTGPERRLPTVLGRQLESERWGLDPDVWFGQVERVVAEQVGMEPVIYVRNIFKYYVTYRLMQDADEGTPVTVAP